jgi:hypothetical protein
VNRSGKDEPVWVAIHKCMEAMLGISLHSYLYFKVAKTLCLSYYLLCSLFDKITTRGWNRFCLEAEVRWDGEGVRRDVAQTI